MDQVVPRLRPGGRKKLSDGFETQGTILLFRHFDGFTDKRKLLFQRTITYTFIIQEHPKLALEEETGCTTLSEPVPLYYVLPTGKHFNEQMQPATLVALSSRRAEIETAAPLPRYANIMFRFEAEASEEEAPEFYAQVIRPPDEASNLYLIHFTSMR